MYKMQKKNKTKTRDNSIQMPFDKKWVHIVINSYNEILVKNKKE